MDEPELRPLGPEEVGLLYRRELKGTFPPSELKPLPTIQRHMRAGRYPAWGLYQGEELAAYALLWQTVDGRAVLLDYLGVPRDRRGQGWGSRMLAQLRRIYGERAAILAEVEAPEAAEPGERSLQERRLDFYRRAGFRYAGFDSRLFGVHYRLLAAGAGEEPEPGRSRSCWRPTAPCIRDTFPALCSGGSCRSRGAGRSKPADWERPSAVKIL